MSYNLPDGCTESDIDRAYEGKPRSPITVIAEIKYDLASMEFERLMDEPFELRTFIKNHLNVRDAIVEELEGTITNQEIEEELRENWDYVQRGRESGYVPK